MIDDTYFNALCALLGAFLSFFLGGLDGILKLLVVFAILDQITGLLKAAILGKWSSEVGFNGIARKICMFIMVGMANVVDKEMLSRFGHFDILRDTVSMFYLANEGLSIIENAIELGVPVPDSLKERFMMWHNKKFISKNNPDDDE